MKQKRLIACFAVVLVLTASLAAGAGAGATAGVSTGTVQSASAQPTCSFPFEKTDATGTAVTVESEPGRVVALQPSAAQTMWEIGAKKKVVGLPVGPYTSFLNGSKSGDRTDITKQDGYTTNIESVVSLTPDLVLAPNVVSNETVEKLRSAGLTVYKFKSGRSIEDIYRKTTLTGQLVGACQGANQRVKAMNETVSSIESAVEDRDRPRVLYLMGDGYTPGNGTFINRVITLAGGENIATNAGITGYKQISPESVIKQDPQWIVVGSDTPKIPNRTAYTETTALKQNQTVVVNSNYISQPAPRVVTPMSSLARSLHPDAFEQTNTTDESTATDGETSTETTNATSTGTTETNGPGFGVIAAMLALLGATLVARLRQ